MSIIAVAVFLLSFNISWAQEPGLGINYAANIGLERSDGDLRDLLVNIIKYILSFLGIIAVSVIMYAGYLWMTSGGSADRLAQAKKTLTNGVIGLIIIVLSFAIVTFIVNLLGDGLSGIGDGQPRPGGIGQGMGVIGACTVESVYPEPGQLDVPRNTSIIVSFKEPVNPMTICGAAICNGSPIVAENIRLFNNNQGDSCWWDGSLTPPQWVDCDVSNIVDVSVTQAGNIFVFVPNNYLGSASEIIWHTMRLTNDITDVDGNGIFNSCRNDFLAWSFEVSNRLDLTPPIVRSGGVYPFPDDGQDTSTMSSATAATGQIVVNAQPAFYRPAQLGPLGVVKNPPLAIWNDADASVNIDCVQDGDITVEVIDDMTGTVRFSRGAILLGSATFNANQVTFSGCFTLSVLGDGTYATGNSWNVPIIGRTTSDSLRVGSTNYRFIGSGVPAGNEFLIGADINSTAASISGQLNSTNIQVSATVAANVINITASTPGSAGNSIALSSDNNIAFAFTPMSGGTEAGITVVPVDLLDKPRNSVIQINFNEAINPITVSGDATAVSNVIRVRCVSGTCDGIDTGVCPDCINGSFVISNQYRTIEFISDNECGANGCGDPIYCLPADSELLIELDAASLEACINCTAKSPYTACNVHCQNPTSLEFYPLANFSALDGIMDAALNSFDGDRSGDALGPGSSWNENTMSGLGDDFIWSFWINNTIDATPPAITLTTPANIDTNVDLDLLIEIQFDKYMMSSSLRTGKSVSWRNDDSVIHSHINLRNFAGRSTGYWITKEDFDSEPDGFVDYTTAYINHSDMAEAVSYRAQAGSGLRDINQNCFKPSDGPACVGIDDANPSCCSGTVSSDPTCP
ncbi:Ig-like domain-containing protein [Candidatus Parcubacteria bacterium]|nr:Ig-like domain-containing protein [Candidatus Parcubacteria bacterium]